MSTALERLVVGIRGIVRAEQNPKQVGEAVAGLLRPCLAVSDLLDPDQIEPDADGYRQQILHVELDGSFSIAALIWLPGQSTPVHDHVSWCVVGVYKGCESETKYRLAGEGDDRRLIEIGRARNEQGSTDVLVPPGDVHCVANGGDDVAVSIHVYGADLHALGCSIRRTYTLPVGQN